LSTIELPTFDGKLSLKSFLAKLQNCSDYYNWTDRKKNLPFESRAGSPVAQILCQIKRKATEKQIIDQLRNRFVLGFVPTGALSSAAVRQKV